MSRTFEAISRLESDNQTPTPVPTPLTKVVSKPATGQNGKKSVRLGDEEVLKLVQRVFRSSQADAPHAVVFSGVDHGDGGTWITANAGLTLAAQTTASICLVDANLRTPSLHGFFEIENRFGLVEATTQAGPVRDFAQRLAGSNLWVLTCGSIANHKSVGALNAEGLRARIAELRSEFDYVLVDTPPANLYADAVTVARHTDGIILVLQSNSTRREAALKAKESFENAHVRLLGAVLNKRTYPIPQNLYSRL